MLLDSVHIYSNLKILILDMTSSDGFKDSVPALSFCVVARTVRSRTVL